MAEPAHAAGGHQAYATFERIGRCFQELNRIMDRWRHSGFSVYCGPRIHPRERKSLERLAACLIRYSFSQERMEYLPEEGKVCYDAMEWLAAMGTHVPERGQQSVRYYGFLSNAARGKRRKDQGQDPLPIVLEPEVSSEDFRRNWARMIQKIFESGVGGYA